MTEINSLIGYDFDGVLCDTMPCFVRHWKDKYDFTVADVETRTFNLDFFPEYDFKNAHDDIAEAINTYNQYCYPHTFAMEIVREIANRLNQVPIIITSRPEVNKEITEAWLQHWLGIPYLLIMIDGKSKADSIAEQEGMIYFVEDRYRTVHSISHLVEKVYMPIRVWNTGRELKADNIIPVGSLVDVYEDMFE